MKLGIPTQRFLLVVFCLSVIHASPKSVVAQNRSEAQILQDTAIAKIDEWVDYVRRTGDAKSTVGELAKAELALYSSSKQFLDAQDFAGAA